MLALRCGPRLLGLLSGPRSAPLLLSATRTCSDGGAREANSSSRNPLVYLDVGADGQPLGRVVLEVRLGHRENLDFPGPVLCLAHRVTLGLSFPLSKEAASAWSAPGLFKTLGDVEEKVKVRSY